MQETIKTKMLQAMRRSTIVNNKRFTIKGMRVDSKLKIKTKSSTKNKDIETEEQMFTSVPIHAYHAEVSSSDTEFLSSCENSERKTFKKDKKKFEIMMDQMRYQKKVEQQARERRMKHTGLSGTKSSRKDIHNTKSDNKRLVQDALNYYSSKCRPLNTAKLPSMVNETVKSKVNP
jgi:hypothetical protein